jgi:N-acylneuraminate cytidylyltransferase
VTAVREARDHPWWAWTRDEAGFHPFFSAAEMSKGRHELPPAFAENGAIFIVSAATLRRGTLYGVRVEPYPMPEAVSLDIDTAEDFALAEYLLGRTR